MEKNNIHVQDYINVILKRRWVVITFFVVTVTTVAIGTFRMKPVYRATCLMLIEKERPNYSYQEGVAIETGQEDYYQTQYKLLKSRSLLQDVVSRLNLKMSPEFFGSGDQAGKLAQAVSIEPVRASRLVNVNVDLTDPALAAGIANTLANIFVKQNLESRAFLSKELLEVIPGKNLDELTQNMKLIEALPSVVNNRLVQELKSEYARREAQWADLSYRYKEKHPKMLQLKNEMKALASRIQAEIKNVAGSVKTELESNLRANNIRVIDMAEIPDRPIKPSVMLNLMLSVIVSLVIGVILAFFIEYMDVTVKTQEDIETHIQIPFLGLIPSIANAKKGENPLTYFHTVSNQHSIAAEAFRSIRTGLLFSAAVSDLKSILITSASAKEGKTTFAYNLAITLAQGGNRVLLIEADLRRDPIHEHPWEKIKEKANGLSEYLAKDVELDNVVINSPVENLSWISSGIYPPNPTELLSSERMQTLIDAAQRNFDRVIIDSPPVMPVADSLILANRVSGVVFVVHAGHTNRDMAARAVQKLKELEARIIGAVLNNVNLERSGYYYPYYYYYGGKNKTYYTGARSSNSESV